MRRYQILIALVLLLATVLCLPAIHDRKLLQRRGVNKDVKQFFNGLKKPFVATGKAMEQIFTHPLESVDNVQKFLHAPVTKSKKYIKSLVTSDNKTSSAEQAGTAVGNVIGFVGGFGVASKSIEVASAAGATAVGATVPVV